MEWRAQGTQIWRIKADTEKSHQEVLLTTNWIEEAIMENNHIFSRKWETTHDWIDHWLEEHLLLKTCMVELESLLGLQQTALQHCQDTVEGWKKLSHSWSHW